MSISKPHSNINKKKNDFKAVSGNQIEKHKPYCIKTLKPATNVHLFFRYNNKTFIKSSVVQYQNYYVRRSY